MGPSILRNDDGLMSKENIRQMKRVHWLNYEDSESDEIDINPPVESAAVIDKSRELAVEPLIQRLEERLPALYKNV